jgi:hypothetical protein
MEMSYAALNLSVTSGQVVNANMTSPACATSHTNYSGVIGFDSSDRITRHFIGPPFYCQRSPNRILQRGAFFISDVFTALAPRKDSLTYRYK